MLINDSREVECLTLPTSLSPKSVLKRRHPKDKRVEFIYISILYYSISHVVIRKHDFVAEMSHALASFEYQFSYVVLQKWIYKCMRDEQNMKHFSFPFPTS